MPLILDSYVSGFHVLPYRQPRLKEWAVRMSTPNDGVIYDDNVAQVLKETGFGFEETPRSRFDPDQLYSTLNKFGPTGRPPFIMTPSIEAGVALARACFQRKQGDKMLDPLPFNMHSIRSMTSNPTASAGLTAYGQTKREAEVRAHERGLQTLRKTKKPEPCLAFARTQFNNKTRLVWGFPYSMTVIEGLLARPLTEEFKKGFTPMAFAKATGVLGAELRTASYRKKFAYSIDMSSYDATIPTELIDIAFDILETWFDPLALVTNEISVRDVWRVIRKYFIYTPIVMPDMNIYHGKDHGVPSGSYFTQIVDSIVNVIICGSLAAKMHLAVDKRDIFVLGDDLLFWSNTKVDLKALAEYATSVFGVKFNAEKSAIYKFDEPVHYLGRDWVSGVPDSPVEEILARLVYPERFRHYSKDPDDRRRETALLIFSFATVYKSAWWILRRTQLSERSPAWRIPPESIDLCVRGKDRSILVRTPDHLSGLARFTFLHAGEQTWRRSLAILFWR